MEELQQRPQDSQSRDGEFGGVEDLIGSTPLGVAYINVTNSYASSVYGLLHNLTYLGPLREKLQRVYEQSGDPPSGVGSRGQLAPQVLFFNRNRPEYARIQTWLRRFGFEGTLQPIEVSEELFQLRLVDGEGVSVNVVDSGFGLSQVIPIIVEGLLSRPGAMLVAAQPEIHLNPKLQAVLADLFVEVALTGRNVLVETHSEHLVLRLRRLIAEGAFRVNDVALLYVEKTGSRSTVKPVPMDAIGHSLWDAVAIGILWRKFV